MFRCLVKLLKSRVLRGGRTFEVEIAESMCFLQRIAEEVAVQGEIVILHLILDRGFHLFAKWIESKNWGLLKITIGAPSFLNAPTDKKKQKKDEKKEKDKKKKARKVFEGPEAVRNREIASERWINEWSVGALKHARLFHRLLDLTILSKINVYLTIAAAIVNFSVINRISNNNKNLY